MNPLFGRCSSLLSNKSLRREILIPAQRTKWFLFCQNLPDVARMDKAIGKFLDGQEDQVHRGFEEMH